MHWSFPIVAGAVALVQMTFLPGHIVLRAMRVRRPLVETLLLAFMLSGLLNFFDAWLRVVFGVYTHQELWKFVGLEAIAWVLLGLRNRALDRASPLAADEHEFPGDTIKAWLQLSRAEQGVVISATALALYALYATSQIAVQQGFDGAYVIWDTVFSWNEWSMEWTHGTLPLLTYHYPQLLPCNVSVSYVLMQSTTLQFIGKFYYWLLPHWHLSRSHRSRTAALPDRLTFLTMIAYAAAPGEWPPPDPGSGHAGCPSYLLHAAHSLHSLERCKMCHGAARTDLSPSLVPTGGCGSIPHKADGVRHRLSPIPLLAWGDGCCGTDPVRAER